MYGISVSAPGKLFLSGEYAVLEGAEAVVDSVGRRVRATPVRSNIPQSQLLRDVKEAVARFLFDRSGAPAGQLPNVDIDSTGFSTSTHKLGIGSSAAVAASATGALFEWAGLSIGEHLETICDVATTAHRAYQNGKGSGADVATSVFGGTIIFSPEQPVQQSKVIGIEKVFVWTGKPASTVSMVAQVRQLRDTAPDLYREVMTPLVSLANALADGYRTGDLDKLVALTSEYGKAMSRLGDAADISIVTDKMTWISEIAEQCHGASKPSGAGGGDAVLALFRSPDEAGKFISQMRCQGELEVFDFDTHVQGLKRES